MSPRLCGEQLEVQSYVTPPPPPRPPVRPYAPSGPGRTRGTRLHPLLCGEELHVQSLPDPPPRSVSLPQAAHAGPEGLGCICRSVGMSWKSNRTRHPHVA